MRGKAKAANGAIIATPPRIRTRPIFRLVSIGEAYGDACPLSTTAAMSGMGENDAMRWFAALVALLAGCSPPAEEIGAGLMGRRFISLAAICGLMAPTMASRAVRQSIRRLSALGRPSGAYDP
jgi:hypothetical protein